MRASALWNVYRIARHRMDVAEVMFHATEKPEYQQRMWRYGRLVTKLEETISARVRRLESEVEEAHAVLDSLGALVGLGREYSVDQRIDDLINRVAQTTVSESHE